jgi:hypothetical protein
VLSDRRAREGRAFGIPVTRNFHADLEINLSNEKGPHGAYQLSTRWPSTTSVKGSSPAPRSTRLLEFLGTKQFDIISMLIIQLQCLPSSGDAAWYPVMHQRDKQYRDVLTVGQHHLRLLTPILWFGNPRPYGFPGALICTRLSLLLASFYNRLYCFTQVTGVFLHLSA